MLMFFASDVVVSKGYQNAPALKFSEKGDFVRFRVGQKVYDPRAEENHRWINITVKSFDPALIDRIRKMGLKEGSFISLSGRYDEDVWEDEETKEKRSMPCVILDNLEYSGGGRRSGDGQKAGPDQKEAEHSDRAREKGDQVLFDGSDASQKRQEGHQGKKTGRVADSPAGSPLPCSGGHSAGPPFLRPRRRRLSWARFWARSAS